MAAFTQMGVGRMAVQRPRKSSPSLLRGRLCLRTARRVLLPGATCKLAPHSPAVMFLLNPNVTFLELDGVLLSCRRKKIVMEGVQWRRGTLPV